MNYWRFTFKDDSFSLTLPENWSEFDGDDENTAAFINTIEWSGNLRITPFHWNGVEDNDKAAEYIQSEVDEDPLTEMIQLSSWNAAFQVKHTPDNDVIYYWVTGAKNNLFICSFTIDKTFFGTVKNAAELQIVINILGTIELGPV